MVSENEFSFEPVVTLRSPFFFLERPQTDIIFNARKLKLLPITCHSLAIHPSHACTASILLFVSLLFILLHQKKLSLLPGKACGEAGQGGFQSTPGQSDAISGAGEGHHPCMMVLCCLHVSEGACRTCCCFCTPDRDLERDGKVLLGRGSERIGLELWFTSNLGLIGYMPLCNSHIEEMPLQKSDLEICHSNSSIPYYLH